MKLNEYVKKFKTLIARERNSEIEVYSEEIKKLTGRVRERKGRAVIGVKRQQNLKLEGDSIFRFVKIDNSKIPQNEFSIGGNVLISRGKPFDNSLNGVIVSKSQMFIDIYIASQSNIIFSNELRIDLYVNDATYKVQNKILDNMKNWSFEYDNIKEILLHNRCPSLGPVVDFNFYDNRLNSSQQLAVNYSLREKEFYLIQGPPGTGKTKTSIEIIRQHLKKGANILVSADSNMAVDNIMSGLLRSGVNVVRVGESPKIMKEIQEHTLGRLIEKDIRYKFIEDGFIQIKKFKEKQRCELIPNKKNSRGLSYFQIRKLAERNQADYGIDADSLKSMAKWIFAWEKIKNAQNKIEKLKNQLIKDKILSASVICTTNTNAFSLYLEGINFDLVLIDEAGQSTEPSCLIPISKSKKVILVGDHKQLPPTILSQDALELSVSLFERMITNCRYSLLDIQYRMHPLINEFPSGEFYEGKLQSDDSTNSHLLFSRVFEKNVIFMESFGREGIVSRSFYNEMEVEKVLDIVMKYANCGLKSDEIGVISPYNEQVKRIKEKMPLVEVNSIDGFQGREKKIIIISLVRSNDKGKIGFLKDLRRLNVALTRAIDELVVIGNPKTIISEGVYNRFLEFVKKKGTYVYE